MKLDLRLPRRQTVASAGLLVLFALLALAGFASFVYGFWIFWKPGAFLVTGILLGLAGFFGALGHSVTRTAPKPEDW